MAYALIEDGIVIQLWLPDNPPEGYVEVPEFVQPGYLFDGVNFTAPAPTPAPVPPLSRLTFWLAAAEVGVTKAGIRAYIDAMPEGLEKFQALAYLEEAQVYRRNDPLLIQMAAVEGIAEPELDALWTWAAQAYS